MTQTKACLDARSLAADVLASHAEGLPRQLEARLLASQDLDALFALRAAVLAQLDDPDHYRPENEPEGFVQGHLDRLGLSIGLFHGLSLVAYGALGLPSAEDRNLGCDAGLPVAELAEVAHLASAMVQPGFRGQNLHRWLTGVRLALAEALGRRHVFSTISPLNHVSWGNLAAFAVYPRRFLKPRTTGAVPRLLLHRDTRAPLRMDAASVRLVPVKELHYDEKLFEDNCRLWANLKLPDAAFAVAARACV